MISKERFHDLYRESKERASLNFKAEKVDTNGTSQEVLDHLRTLSDMSVMETTVANLEKQMFETFNSVHKGLNAN